MMKKTQWIQTVSVCSLCAVAQPVTANATPYSAQDDCRTATNTNNPRTNSSPDAQLTLGDALQNDDKIQKKQKRVKFSFPSANLPVILRRLTVADLANIPNIDIQLLRTVAAIQKKIKTRRQNLLQYRFVDVNDDGILEAAVLSQNQLQNRLRQTLSIYSFDQTGRLSLRFEHHQNISQAATNYEKNIEIDNSILKICENWAIASWNFKECQKIVFDADWNARVAFYELQTREPLANASQSIAFDFAALRAKRAYSHLPQGAFMPAIRRDAQFDMIFATRNPSLPPEISQNTSFGDHNIPLQFSASWNDQSVHLSIHAADDDIDKTTDDDASCNDTLSIQTMDHIELWFDLDPALSIDRNTPQTWQFDYENTYRQMPFRHDIDAAIFALAITPSGCIVPIHPIRDYWRNLPSASVSSSPNGYRIDIDIDAGFFDVDSLQKIAGPQGFGLTIRQHDRHQNGDFDNAQSSQFQWPDPFTFGQIWLLNRNRFELPLFPLEWNDFTLNPTQAPDQTPANHKSSPTHG